MRASKGVIEKVFSNSSICKVTAELIGDDKTLHSKGSCGSGIFDVIGELKMDT